jgi:hypothetical protein
MSETIKRKRSRVDPRAPDPADGAPVAPPVLPPGETVLAGGTVAVIVVVAAVGLPAKVVAEAAAVELAVGDGVEVAVTEPVGVGVPRVGDGVGVVEPAGGDGEGLGDAVALEVGVGVSAPAKATPRGATATGAAISRVATNPTMANEFRVESNDADDSGRR